MTDKILYRVLCNEYEEVARIFFEVTETGEQIEGAHQIQKWINSLFEENEKLKSENEDMRRLINNISHQRDEFHRGARENANRVGKLNKENEELKSKINMLKVTIGRNEAYIKRLTEKSNWRTSAYE